MKTIGLRVVVALVILLAPTTGTHGPANRRRARTIPSTAQRTGGKTPGSGHPERGDVPGWVMITLMSAVLVAALLALAGPALEAMFNQAMDTVGG
ncbi:hypothetical protein [Arthrobacter sp. Leaf141]|uniref:hypothetical protein n=1 Tax=Arthrobacter sp. Leaf141 TaxID=1736273 RepID=UPI000A6E224B|nr:hypothetical protein [Arthrobacter sp. Leaf141]